MLQPKLEILSGKKFAGKRTKMSISNNKTYNLWGSFMPVRKEIKNRIGTELYSIEVYDRSYFKKFDPDTKFEKWAAVEVTDFDMIPDEMETITLKKGLYAVFLHKGPASTGPKTYQYIFKEWLPGSDFLLDNRSHFAVMGEKYQRDDLNSEEELWIPVKRILMF